jgi:hypothetical protein
MVIFPSNCNYVDEGSLGWWRALLYLVVFRVQILTDIKIIRRAKRVSTHKLMPTRKYNMRQRGSVHCQKKVTDFPTNLFFTMCSLIQHAEEETFSDGALIKKENKIVLIYQEFQMGSGAKSYTV